MGIFDRFREAVNTDEEYDYPMVEDDLGPAQDPATTASNSAMSINAISLELKVVKPDRYENVTQIADHLLNHRTVVLNLEATNKETARRIIDFLSGVAYSINGQLKRVANNTFVISPDNVNVTGDQMRVSEQKRNAIHAENIGGAPGTDTLY